MFRVFCDPLAAPLFIFWHNENDSQLLREGLQVPASLGKVSDKFLVQTAGLGERESALLTAVPAPKQSEAVRNENNKDQTANI